VPKVDLKKNLKTYLALEKAIQKELIASSLSVTSGGLGIALAKACVGGMLGCKVSISGVCQSLALANVKLFSESQGRILVSVSPKNVAEFEKIVKNVPHAKLGKVTRDGKVIITDKPARAGGKKIVETNVKKLYAIYHSFSNKMK